MNRHVERCPNEMSGGTAAGAAVARAAGRISQFFRSADTEQADEVADPLEMERLKERARIARELHDTLLQGFLSASLQIHSAVEQLPDDSPAKPSLERALSLMERVLDEGRDALLGLHSRTSASMS